MCVLLLRAACVLLHMIVFLWVSIRAIDLLILVDLPKVHDDPTAPILLVRLVCAPLWIERGFIIHVGPLD
jgi:hypothetical protein